MTERLIFYSGTGQDQCNIITAPMNSSENFSELSNITFNLSRNLFKTVSLFNFQRLIRVQLLSQEGIKERSRRG